MSTPQGLIRRYAQMGISGVNEPRVFNGINIPIGPAVIPPSTDPKVIARKRSRARRHESDLDVVEIESIEFSLYSTSEIDVYSEFTVTRTEKEGEGTVNDLRSGPQTEGCSCPTCGSDLRGCPGHYGKIVIPRIIHPLAVQSLILTLSCICRECSRLLVTQDDLQVTGINKLHGTRRLEAIHALVRRIENTRELRESRTCQHGVLGHGGVSCAPNPIYAKPAEDKFDFRIGAYRKAGQRQRLEAYLSPDDVYRMLDAIPNEDAQLLGFTESHPRNMIMERVLVIPYNSRPNLYQDGNLYIDDLTGLYIAIVHEVIRFRTAVRVEDRNVIYTEIVKRVTHLMKSENKLNQGNKKIVGDVRRRVQGKTGIIRANLMGKRVNFAGRTVIGPAYYLRVDEVGVPRLMARELTRPIPVAEFNRNELQSKMDSGKIRFITMQSGRDAGYRQGISESFFKMYPDYRLQIGDIVERMLENGDLVLVNRQPSLHKQNILALYAVIIDDRIIRLNLSVTTPLNADFDGDEANIHVPQTIESYAEAEQLLAVQKNILTAESNRPIMGIVYDTLSGAYLLTHPQADVERLETEIVKATQRQIDIPNQVTDLRLQLNTLQSDSPEYRQLEQAIQRLTEESEGIQRTLEENRARETVLRERIIIDPIIFNQAIENVVDSSQYPSLPERLDKYGVHRHSGRALISAAFPEDFDYNANDVLIKEGILIKGTLTKNTLGNKDGSIISEMTKQLGGQVTVDFMSDIQFIVRDYLQGYGLSVGIQDCIPDDPDFRRNLDEILATANLKVVSMVHESTNEIISQMQERKIQERLDIVKTEGDKIMQKYYRPDNTIIIMANSGSKGTVYNAVQMSSALGQQRVSGQRIQANLPGNRALPIVEPGSKDPRDQGFCYNSFGSGLEPKEFFFHVQGGREGLVDTAVSTAQTGHLQHQLVKSAEDIHISPDGSVRASDNSIVQFVYGDDGYDASELTSVTIHGEKIPLFRNLQQLADKINRKYGVQ